MINLDRIFILLLALDAMIVMLGVSVKKNMWMLIFLYWVILFTKNMMNFMAAV